MYEASEHVPGLEVHERRNEVQPICCSDRDDELSERLISLNKPRGSTSALDGEMKEHSYVLREVLPSVDIVGDGEIDCVARAPQGDHITQPEEDHSHRVRPFGALIEELLAS